MQPVYMSVAVLLGSARRSILFVWNGGIGEIVGLVGKYRILLFDTTLENSQCRNIGHTTSLTGDL